LYYLGDVNTSSPDLISTDFNLSTGKPLKNLSPGSVVDDFFVNTLNRSMADNLNVHQKFIFDYPLVLEMDSARDIDVTGETTISATFIHEGASMKNMFGYYFYITDSGGNNVLLDNDGTDSSVYYRPTVIFPHVVSETGNSDTLRMGDLRQMRSNLSNGNFQNANIGFFLMPHGWLAKSGNDLYSDVTTLYSTIEFCQKHRDSDYQMVNDKIYSVFCQGPKGNGRGAPFRGVRGHRVQLDLRLGLQRRHSRFCHFGCEQYFQLQPVSHRHYP
jgi:hypothetical protein